MSEPAGVTYELPHKTPACPGDWTQELHGRRMYWRCAGCGLVCYDAPGVLEAIQTDRAMGIMLERLTRAGEERLLEDE